MFEFYKFRIKRFLTCSKCRRITLAKVICRVLLRIELHLVETKCETHEKSWIWLDNVVAIGYSDRHEAHERYRAITTSRSPRASFKIQSLGNARPRVTTLWWRNPRVGFFIITQNEGCDQNVKYRSSVSRLVGASWMKLMELTSDPNYPALS